jgi:hypothetical protein
MEKWPPLLASTTRAKTLEMLVRGGTVERLLVTCLGESKLGIHIDSMLPERPTQAAVWMSVMPDAYSKL